MSEKTFVPTSFEVLFYRRVSLPRLMLFQWSDYFATINKIKCLKTPRYYSQIEKMSSLLPNLTF